MNAIPEIPEAVHRAPQDYDYLDRKTVRSILADDKLINDRPLASRIGAALTQWLSPAFGAGLSRRHRPHRSDVAGSRRAVGPRHQCAVPHPSPSMKTRGDGLWRDGGRGCVPKLAARGTSHASRRSFDEASSRGVQ
jgi:hypothetical protein